MSYMSQCVLGASVEMSKFKRYTTTVEIVHEMGLGRPIAVLLFGSKSNWRAGSVVASQNFQYFQEVEFVEDGDSISDPFSLTYHRVSQVESEICFGKDGSDKFKNTLGDYCLPFWDYGILFPDIIHDTGDFRYAIVKTGWQYLDVDQKWSEFE